MALWWQAGGGVATGRRGGDAGRLSHVLFACMQELRPWLWLPRWWTWWKAHGATKPTSSRHTTIVTVETSDGQREQRLKAVEGGRYVGLTSHLKDLLEVRSQMRWWCIREKINQSPILMLTSWLMMMDPTHNNQPPSCNTLCLSSPGDHPVLQAVPGQGFRHQHLAQPW
jgi:hypothetical protein